jgi:hypothetical protein
MIVLNARVHDAEVRTPGGDDRRLANTEVEVSSTQPRGAADDPDRHAHRMVWIMR